MLAAEARTHALDGERPIRTEAPLKRESEGLTRSAATTNVYGRRNARRTIHMAAHLTTRTKTRSPAARRHAAVRAREGTRRNVAGYYLAADFDFDGFVNVRKVWYGKSFGWSD